MLLAWFGKFLIFWDDSSWFYEYDPALLHQLNRILFGSILLRFYLIFHLIVILQFVMRIVCVSLWSYRIRRKMAAMGVYSSPKMDFVEGRCVSLINSSTSLKPWPMIGRTNFPIRRKRLQVNCSLPNTMSPFQSEEDAAALSSSDSLDDDFSHVTKFKMSDFKIRNRVSIGLGGRVMEFPWLLY